MINNAKNTHLTDKIKDARCILNKVPCGDQYKLQALMSEKTLEEYIENEIAYFNNADEGLYGYCLPGVDEIVLWSSMPLNKVWINIVEKPLEEFFKGK